MTQTIQTDQRYFRPGIETTRRDRLHEIQWHSLRNLLRTILEHNPFYQGKLWDAGVRSWEDIATFDDFRCLPFTTRPELAADQELYPPYGSNLTWPLEQYIKWFRTSGTSGKPLIVLMTGKDWELNAEAWCYGASAIGIQPGDSLFAPVHFGPFAAHWTTEAGARLAGVLAIPGGGMSTLQRIEFILQYRPAVVTCLPSYALRLAEVACEHGQDLRTAGVRALVHGGEPGPASVPSLRARIEKAWRAHSYDIYGLSEAGRLGYECAAQTGLHLLESMNLIEVLDPDGSEPVPEGDVGELVVTPMYRTGMPLIRYRTRDLVRLTTATCACGRTMARLDGGILGRTDGMVVVRGINIYPTAIENVVMSYAEVSEYQVEIYEHRGMKQLRIRVELAARERGDGDGDSIAGRIAQDLHCRLSLRAEVEILPPGSLPRWEGKARRFIHRRSETLRMPGCRNE